MSTDISLIIPIYNEEEFLSKTLDAFIDKVLRASLGAGLSTEILFVANGCTDHSCEVIKKRAVPSSLTIRVLHCPRADYGQAVKTGIESANGMFILKFDFDWWDADFFYTAVDKMKSGTKIIFGGKKETLWHGDRSFFRRAITHVRRRLNKRLLGGVEMDPQGLMAGHTSVLKDLSRQCRFGRDLYTIELLFKARQAGLSPLQIPVRVRDVRPARTNILWRGVLFLLDSTRFFIKYRSR
ncbi:MAG TPA: glycosyltransferase [Elusimicrobiota bacterium]|nr:glycosyltransferase [Elusimicrobiota bacterium]